MRTLNTSSLIFFWVDKSTGMVVKLQAKLGQGPTIVSTLISTNLRGGMDFYEEEGTKKDAIPGFPIPSVLVTLLIFILIINRKTSPRRARAVRERREPRNDACAIWEE